MSLPISGALTPPAFSLLMALTKLVAISYCYTIPLQTFSGYYRGFPSTMLCNPSALRLPCYLDLHDVLHIFQVFHLCRVPCLSTACAGLRPVSLLHFPPSGFFTPVVSASVTSAFRSCLLVKTSTVYSTTFVCPALRLNLYRPGRFLFKVFFCF